MRTLILIIAVLSLSFNNVNSTENFDNTTKLINIDQLFDEWYVTDAYTLKDHIKSDAMKEVRSAKFVFESNNVFKIIDCTKGNSVDKGNWKLNKDNSIDVTLYESKINFKIQTLNENYLELVSYGKKTTKVITFSSEEL